MSLIGRRPPQWDESTPDDELVGWTRRGQREAFGTLYDRYLDRVYGYCYRVLGEPEAAQDANSLVFTKALANLSGYHPGASHGSFRSWLFAIAHNAIADELRARHDAAPLETAAWVIDPAPSPEERAMRADARHSVIALLPRLSTDQASVISMRLSGLTAVEIGIALGRPRNAIDGIQHRAVLRLQAIVAQHAAAAAKGGGGRA